jgi:uncharacterized protein YndB with AHSA1/START domain
MKKNLTTISAEGGKQEIFMAREFEASPEIVFKAYTNPELVVQWLGGQCDFSMRIETFEARPGVSYRYIHTQPNGTEYGFHGVFHECISPELIIQTFEFEGFPEKGHAVLEIIRFEALPNKRTKVGTHSVFQSVSDRDNLLRSGMEKGITASHERLDALIVNYQ